MASENIGRRSSSDNLSRRSLLQGAALAPVAAFVACAPAVAANPNAELLALEQQWLAVNAAVEPLYDARSAATRQACDRLGGRSIDPNYEEWVGYIKEAYSDAQQAEEDRLTAIEIDVERRIFAAEPHTFSDLAVKLRMALRSTPAVKINGVYYDLLDAPINELDQEQERLVLVLRDVERLAGSAVL